MAEYSEIDALKDAHDILLKLSDSEARQRVLTWLWSKFGTQQVPTSVGHGAGDGEERVRRPSGKGKKKTERNAAAAKKRTSAGRPSIDKDLNLRPDGKEPFLDFIAAKQPNTNHEKCVVAVYYLRRVLETTATANAIYTCFKQAGWRVPADLRNTLQVCSSRNGWLDTKNSDDIRMTTHGENHVEHDLPAKKIGSK